MRCVARSFGLAGVVPGGGKVLRRRHGDHARVRADPDGDHVLSTLSPSRTPASNPSAAMSRKPLVDRDFQRDVGIAPQDRSKFGPATFRLHVHWP